MKKRLLLLLMLCSLTCSAAAADGFRRVAEYRPFDDVPASAWYADGVRTACELGLVRGSGASFRPEGRVTVAESLALACRLNDLYHGGSGFFRQGTPWYQVYVDRAVQRGIIGPDTFRDYTAAANREQLARLLAAALPAEALPAVNHVTKIPDVPFQAGNEPIYRLYNAGVLTGSDAYGRFRPGDAVSRAEMAVIAARLADPGRRVVFSPGPGKRIAIDAGHQLRGNFAREPVGPGAAETKLKVSGGTQGVATGKPEYALTLEVALKLKAELLARGYEVVMIRESNEVDISNAQRAAVANRAGADAFLRIHANGSDDSGASGVLTICQTAKNPYNQALYTRSRRLAGCVLDGVIQATGAKREGIWETDTMSGINWCQVPVAIVEMGYMTNPAEDRLLATEAYQNRLAVGMADGLDAYFAGD